MEMHHAWGGCWGCQHEREHGAEGHSRLDSYSQLFMCCLQSKCLVQTRSSIGKQEKKCNKIMLLGAGSGKLLWLDRIELLGAEVGGKAANKNKPSDALSGG